MAGDVKLCICYRYLEQNIAVGKNLRSAICVNKLANLAEFSEGVKSAKIGEAQKKCGVKCGAGILH